MGRLSLGQLIATLFVFAAGTHALAQSSGDASKELGKGLDPSSLREEMIRNPNRVILAKPNRLALERKNKELKAHGKPLLDVRNAAGAGDEISTVRDLNGGATAPTTSDTLTGGAAPAGVDNTTLDAFPPIGSQGSENSCFPFNMTYYVMSHETCLARGCNNKTGDKTNIFSPRWAYNHLNRGVD